MLKCFPVLIVLLSIFSFVALAEDIEPESFSYEDSTLAVETSTETTTEEVFDVEETSTETITEEVTEITTVSGVSDDQATIINRLDMIYTLGLFVVGVFAALLVIFILWRVLDVFLF